MSKTADFNPFATEWALRHQLKEEETLYIRNSMEEEEEEEEEEDEGLT